MLQESVIMSNNITSNSINNPRNDAHHQLPTCSNSFLAAATKGMKGTIMGDLRHHKGVVTTNIPYYSNVGTMNEPATASQASSLYENVHNKCSTPLTQTLGDTKSFISHAVIPDYLKNRISLGLAPVSGLYGFAATDDTVFDLISAAISYNITDVDIAPWYGCGWGELALGRALIRLIAPSSSKVGTHKMSLTVVAAEARVDILRRHAMNKNNEYEIQRSKQPDLDLRSNSERSFAAQSYAVVRNDTMIPSSQQASISSGIVKNSSPVDLQCHLGGRSSMTVRKIEHLNISTKCGRIVMPRIDAEYKKTRWEDAAVAAVQREKSENPPTTASIVKETEITITRSTWIGDYSLAPNFINNGCGTPKYTTANMFPFPKGIDDARKCELLNRLRTVSAQENFGVKYDASDEEQPLMTSACFYPFEETRDHVCIDDYSYEGILHSFAQSYKRLFHPYHFREDEVIDVDEDGFIRVKRSYASSTCNGKVNSKKDHCCFFQIDTLRLHDADTEMKWTEFYSRGGALAMQDLFSRGYIAHIGIGMNFTDPVNMILDLADRENEKLYQYSDSSVSMWPPCYFSSPSLSSCSKVLSPISNIPMIHISDNITTKDPLILGNITSGPFSLSGCSTPRSPSLTTAGMSTRCTSRLRTTGAHRKVNSNTSSVASNVFGLYDDDILAESLSSDVINPSLIGSCIALRKPRATSSNSSVVSRNDGIPSRKDTSLWEYRKLSEVKQREICSFSTTTTLTSEYLSYKEKNKKRTKTDTAASQDFLKSRTNCPSKEPGKQYKKWVPAPLYFDSVLLAGCYNLIEVDEAKVLFAKWDDAKKKAVTQNNRCYYEGTTFPMSKDETSFETSFQLYKNKKHSPTRPNQKISYPGTPTRTTQKTDVVRHDIDTYISDGLVLVPPGLYTSQGVSENLGANHYNILKQCPVLHNAGIFGAGLLWGSNKYRYDYAGIKRACLRDKMARAAILLEEIEGEDPQNIRQALEKLSVESSSPITDFRPLASYACKFALTPHGNLSSTSHIDSLSLDGTCHNNLQNSDISVKSNVSSNFISEDTNNLMIGGDSISLSNYTANNSTYTVIGAKNVQELKGIVEAIHRMPSEKAFRLFLEYKIKNDIV